MNLPEIITQLKSCGYMCEAGPLENNIAFVELEKLQNRLDTLERLYRMIHDRRIAERVFDQAGENGDVDAQSITFGCIDYFEDEIENVMNELEAMGIAKAEET